ncbi:MAG: hypothetical protein K5877_06930 [Lachnospiraceae bacterium]|nr:hypothetical protein [Lachnospiraceae bacterium]
MTGKMNFRHIISVLAAWGIIPLAYLSWCFSTIAYINENFIYISALFGAAAAVIYFFLHQKCNDIGRNYGTELFALDICIVLFGVLFLIILPREYAYDNRLATGLAVFLWICAAVIKIAGFIKKQSSKADAFKKFFSDHWGIIVLEVLTVILSLDSNMYQFKWDGLLYYKAVSEAALSSISKVALYGHIAMTSGGLYRLFGSLAGSIGYGMAITNIVILMIAILSFYGIIRSVFPGRKTLEYVAGTSVFAFSPFLLGMVNYYSTDWFCVNIIVILLYAVLQKRWIWTTILGCLFCMTKEPALIAYTGLCAGLVITDLISEKDLKTGVIRVFRSIHYYFMIIPYILWLLTYKILGQWSAGNGGFDPDIQYMLEKSKVFLVFNFNWIPVFVVAGGIVCLVIRKQSGEHLHWMIPLVMSNIALLLFNLLFKTVNHVRYIDSFISVNILLAVLMIFAVSNSGMKSLGFFSCLSVLSLISCFICIDPITKLMFRSTDVGNTRLMTTGRYSFGDSSIYNKQQLWMEKPISEAIADCIDEDSAIVMAIADSSVYSFDGMSEVINMNSDTDKDLQYWDPVKKRRISYADVDVKGTVPIDVYHVEDGTPVEGIDCENQTISVIYIKGINDYRISSDYRLADSTDYAYRGFIISRDVYSRN